MPPKRRATKSVGVAPRGGGRARAPAAKERARPRGGRPAVAAHAPPSKNAERAPPSNDDDADDSDDDDDPNQDFDDHDSEISSVDSQGEEDDAGDGGKYSESDDDDDDDADGDDDDDSRQGAKLMQFVDGIAPRGAADDEDDEEERTAARRARRQQQHEVRVLGTKHHATRDWLPRPRAGRSSCLVSSLRPRALPALHVRAVS